jgi:hypothetical protein
MRMANKFDEAQECGIAVQRSSARISKLRLGGFKIEAEQAEKSLQQMHAREGELASQLQSEQDRLNELCDRLDQIERSLSPP